MEPLGGFGKEDTACWVAACPRKDCNFWMYVYEEMGKGPWDVPAQFSYLLAPDFAKPNEPVRIEPSENYNQGLARLRAQFEAIDQFSKLNPQLIPRC
jgi:hypothetical protein